VLRYDPENSLAESNTKMLYNYLEYKKLEQANEKALRSTNDFNDIVSLVNMAKKKRKPKILNDKEAELLPRITGSKNALTEVLSVYRKLNFTDNVNGIVVSQNIKQVGITFQVYKCPPTAKYVRLVQLHRQNKCTKEI
jgi:hypothetical protein